MRRGRAVLLLALLLAGCSAPDAPPADAPPEATVALVSIDGRWAFDADAAARLVNASRTGRAWTGEAAFGGAAGEAWGLDEEAARLLDAPAPPAPGEVLLREDAARVAGVAVGDEVDFRAFVWPPQHVTTAFEMDRVRPCDRGSPALLCIADTTREGRARLLLRVPPNARDLRYHPDVVELRAQDYPATWEGEFVSPGGQRTPFQTAARTRTDLDPPGLLPGPLAEGEWAIEFTLTLNGTGAPGAVAGFVTFRAPGFAPFDSEMLREPDGAKQTAAALAAASERTARLRVAGTWPANGTLARLGVAALLAPPDARALLNVSEANVTALVVPHEAGAARHVQDATVDAATPALRALRVRPVAVERAPARTGDDVRWAPADDAPLLAGRLPPDGEARLNGTLLAPGLRLLALPTGPTPWRLAPGAHWPTTEDALKAIAAAPHLVLVSEDLAREAGLDPHAMTYTKLDVESGLGPRTVFAMGAVEGGPARTVWASAALLGALASPAGGRALEGGVPLVR